MNPGYKGSGDGVRAAPCQPLTQFTAWHSLSSGGIAAEHPLHHIRAIFNLSVSAGKCFLFPFRRSAVYGAWAECLIHAGALLARAAGVNPFIKTCGSSLHKPSQPHQLQVACSIRELLGKHPGSFCGPPHRFWWAAGFFCCSSALHQPTLQLPLVTFDGACSHFC